MCVKPVYKPIKTNLGKTCPAEVLESNFLLLALVTVLRHNLRQSLRHSLRYSIRHGLLRSLCHSLRQTLSHSLRHSLRHRQSV